MPEELRVPVGSASTRSSIDLLTPLACPHCRSRTLAGHASVLRCAACGSTSAIRDGVIDMLEVNPVTDRERLGNRAIVHEERATADRAWLLGLPGSFAGTADFRSSMADHDFIADLEQAADCLQLESGAAVIALGAGCCCDRHPDHWCRRETGLTSATRRPALRVDDSTHLL
jgi:uncharacterized protein YbaR (Trm112 family)